MRLPVLNAAFINRAFRVPGFKLGPLKNYSVLAWVKGGSGNLRHLPRAILFAPPSSTAISSSCMETGAISLYIWPLSSLAATPLAFPWWLCLNCIYSWITLISICGYLSLSGEIWVGRLGTIPFPVYWRKSMYSECSWPALSLSLMSVIIFITTRMIPFASSLVIFLKIRSRLARFQLIFQGEGQVFQKRK